FAKFVEWPPEAFTTPNAPFIIGIIGEDPFGTDLERTVRGKSVNGRAFEIKALRSVAEANDCHILFISRSERKKVAEILKAAGAASVLTVSEIEHFTQAGGMINFVMEGNKVRFEINDAAAKKAGLRVSSKLLNLAKRPAK